MLFDELLDALPALKNVQPLCAVKSDWKISPDAVKRDATLLTCAAPHVIGDWSPNDVIALKRVTEIFFRLVGASTVKLRVMRVDVTAYDLTAGKNGFPFCGVESERS